MQNKDRKKCFLKTAYKLFSFEAFYDNKTAASSISVGWSLSAFVVVKSIGGMSGTYILFSY